MNQLMRYSKVAVVFHWLIASLIFAQITLGLWMITLPKSPPGLRASWFNLHKSLGITLGILILLRIIWRLKNKPPEFPYIFSRSQMMLAKFGHFLLYVSMVAMPVSGFLGSSFSKYPIQFFNHALPRLFEPDNQLKDIFSEIHFYSLWLLIGLIVIHISALVKHAIIDRTNLLQRMC